METHTVIPALGEFKLTLEDVMSLTALPLYRETNDMGVIFGGEDEDKLQPYKVLR